MGREKKDIPGRPYSMFNDTRQTYVLLGSDTVTSKEDSESVVACVLIVSG